MNAGNLFREQYTATVNHLGLGHLTMEPICIAYYNWVRRGAVDGKNSVIRKMLGPHMERTLAINWLAQFTLISANDLSVDHSNSIGKREREVWLSKGDVLGDPHA